MLTVGQLRTTSSPVWLTVVVSKAGELLIDEPERQLCVEAEVFAVAMTDEHDASVGREGIKVGDLSSHQHYGSS